MSSCKDRCVRRKAQHGNFVVYKRYDIAGGAPLTADGYGRCQKLHHPTPNVSIFVRIMLLFYVRYEICFSR